MPLVGVEVYNFRGAIWIVDFCKSVREVFCDLACSGTNLGPHLKMVHPILGICEHQLGVSNKMMERKVSNFVHTVHASLTVHAL